MGVPRGAVGTASVGTRRFGHLPYEAVLFLTVVLGAMAGGSTLLLGPCAAPSAPTHGTLLAPMTHAVGPHSVANASAVLYASELCQPPIGVLALELWGIFWPALHASLMMALQYAATGLTSTLAAWIFVGLAGC